MGGSFKKILSKSPVQTIGMRLLQGDSLSNAIFKNAGTPAQRGLHQWIHRTYGNLTRPSGGAYSMPRSSTDMSGMFAGQNQMLASMQAQASADAARRKASNEQLRSSSPLFPTMPTPETATQISQSAPAISAPATIAQSKIDGTTSVASDLPVEFVYKPATPTTKNVAANTFNLPDMSNIKFGGV